MISISVWHDEHIARLELHRRLPRRLAQRELFADRVSSLLMARHTYVERAPSPEEYARLFMDDFGPVIAIRATLDGAPERLAAFDRAFTNAIARWNRGRRDGPAEVAYEYLLVVARKS